MPYVRMLSKKIIEEDNLYPEKTKVSRIYIINFNYLIMENEIAAIPISITIIGINLSLISSLKIK